MSYTLTGIAIDNSKSQGFDRLVLLILADEVQDQNKHLYGPDTCWPSVERIAKKSTVKERRVRLAFRNLEKLNELSIRERQGPHGCNLYTLTIPKVILRGERGHNMPLTGTDCKVSCKPRQIGGASITPEQTTVEQSIKKGETAPRLLWQVDKDLKTIRETLKDARIECGQGETSEGRWTPRLTGADKDRVDALKAKVAALKHERETARI